MNAPSVRRLAGFSSLVVVLLAACAGQTPAPVCPPAPAPVAPAPVADDSATQEKLDYLIAKVDGLEKKLAERPAAPPPRRGPDPAEVYGVAVAGDPVVGPTNALVTIVKASDYACPFCQRSEPTLEQLVKDYPGQVRIVYKDYIVHPQTATVPALAACAAHKQGKFAEFNRVLWDRSFGKDWSEAFMATLAKELGLDVARFQKDMNGSECKQGLADDQKILAAVGVTGTPAFFINGRFMSGARPIEQFKVLVDEELGKAKERIGKDGVTAANYYEKVVVEKGKKTQ
jgi:protein-disulfide isomerase